MNTAEAKGHVVGIDLGGTNLNAGVIDHSNRILGRAHRTTEARGGCDHVIERIASAVDEVCVKSSIPLERIAAVGIAAAGAIDMTRGLVLRAPNLDWDNVPLRDLLSQRIGRPVVVDNDANGAVWGEHQLGAARGCGDTLGVWVGTGVGGGLVLGRKVYRGDRFTAGEIGHTVLDPYGPPGSRTVEDLCGRTGLSRSLLAELPNHPTSILNDHVDGQTAVIASSIVAEAIAGGDEFVRDTAHRSAELLGIAIANWVTVLALDVVIIGGGVTEALGESYLEWIRASFRASVFPPQHADCEIRATILEADAGLLGAALLAREAVGSAT